ncbi:TonB-dependent receptor [Sediminibacterium sp.]|uniref:TonB-dependent receptor n=1 Tax=Sediminibacterium sp. TaxID=1917865 RepID=UPI0025EDE559|nr:TonB-dependent receptor [Sediminibacterium sp.]MBW0176805.1 TonB-dependent receptor [Sediminibacterium sp.]
MLNRLVQVIFYASCLSTITTAQTARQGALLGTLTDKNTQRPITAATIRLTPAAITVLSDTTGVFRFTNLLPGTYNLTLTSLGYKTILLNNLLVTNGNINVLSVEMESETSVLSGVTVTGRRNTARAASIETPLSVQRMTIEEIKRNPGGNFDVSKVIQSLPGVGGGVGGGGFRNDIIIRGGAPNENVYYLDGIEIPLINHFGTQGSGGGPQGILNANFIEEVKLSSSAFDARYDNALSSVLQFKQKTGNDKRTQGNIILSATELALTADGPLSNKTTYLASVRRSYLQLLFQAIDLPIRPNYWDLQFKTTTKINTTTTLSFLGLGAIDEFRFAAPKKATPEKLYVINSNPSINQWNYTFGVSLKKLTAKGFWNLALSRNTLNNSVEKFEDNENPSPATQTLFTDSRETENKLRFDVTSNTGGWKISYGTVLQYVDFVNRFENLYRKELRDQNGNIIQPEVRINANSNIDFIRYGAFLQAGRKILNDRMAFSAGIRMDANRLSNSESNPLKQLSPRLSVSYALAPKWNLNASVGSYYKLPPYTQLAFMRSGIKNSGNYIQSTHYTGGVEYLPSGSFRLTVEGFYKSYSSYPVSVTEGISLANKGTEFGSIGNEAVIQNGKGRAYGMEIFMQKKLTKRFFGLLSYTLYKSEFTNSTGNYLPAGWDNGQLLSITMGYKLPRNWELGLKFRYQGSAPLTPFDLAASQLNYLSLGTGVLDYSKFNANRLPAFHASDIRIDKKWNYKKTTLNLFIDISNWYGATVSGMPQYTFQRTPDNKAFLTTNGQPIAANGSNAIPLILSNAEVQVTPTVGLIVEF